MNMNKKKKLIFEYYKNVSGINTHSNRIRMCLDEKRIDERNTKKRRIIILQLPKIRKRMKPLLLSDVFVKQQIGLNVLVRYMFN